MKLHQTLLIIALSAITAFAVGKYAPISTPTTPAKETAFERVMRTGTLRCGYSIWPPALVKNPNTGRMSGIFYDLMQKIGDQMDIKIEWAAEVSPAHMFTDLNNSRFDMVCSPYIPTPARLKAANFTNPIFYNSLHLYARADDTRFDKRPSFANQSHIKFAVIDGNIMGILAQKRFPIATKVSLPQHATPADSFLYVINEKADLVISEPLTFALFNKSNPNKMKRVEGIPLQVLGAGMPMAAKEFHLKYAIDATLTYLHGIGFIDSILKKHEPEGAHLLRIANPYTPRKN